MPNTETKTSESPLTDKWEYEQSCNFDVPWEDRCRTLEIKNNQLRRELEKANKNIEAIVADFRTVKEERDRLRARITELEAALSGRTVSCETCNEKAEDKEMLDWVEKQDTLAVWQGTFAESDLNISLGRVGAPIVTLSTMDSDGHEVDEEISVGATFRLAIKQAMKGNKV